MSTEPQTTEEPKAEQPAAEPVPKRQLAKLEASDQGVQAILPRDLDQTLRLAQGIIAAGIVPSAFRHKENVRDADDQIIHAKGDPNQPLIVTGILKAMEIGLPPLTGLSYLLPINDRFAVWGDGAVALAQAKGLIANQTRATIGPTFDPTTPMGEWPDEYGVEVRIWRKGQEQPYVGRFTVGDAKRARLWLNTSKQPWIQFPERMLFNRARAFALRDGFADALSGLAIAEEVRDHIEEPKDGGELKAERKAKLFAPEEE